MFGIRTSKFRKTLCAVSAVQKRKNFVRSITTFSELTKQVTVRTSSLEHNSDVQLNDRWFEGESTEMGWGRAFGGQIIGQSISAAYETVDKNRHMHSFSSAFIRPGKTGGNNPFKYKVESLRDGGSFSNRRVIAFQGNKEIYSMTSSFQNEENGLEHNHVAPIPDFPSPEELKADPASLSDSLKKYPTLLKSLYLGDLAVEILPIQREKKSLHHGLWIRIKGEVLKTSDRRINHVMLGYVSDFSFLSTSLKPHGVTVFDPKMQAATLNHSVWFHKPFSLTDWHLYQITSPWAGEGRGIVIGHIINLQGELCATTCQEGLIRYNDN